MLKDGLSTHDLGRPEAPTGAWSAFDRVSPGLARKLQTSQKAQTGHGLEDVAAKRSAGFAPGGARIGDCLA